MSLVAGRTVGRSFKEVHKFLYTFETFDTYTVKTLLTIEMPSATTFEALLLTP